MNTIDKINELNRETWLTLTSDIIRRDIIEPVIETSYPSLDTDIKVSVSVGHPKSKNAIGECWNKLASEDGETYQLFISPYTNDSVEVLATLIHELIHAYDALESGHKGRFATIARNCGLTGKMTATTANDALTEQLAGIVDAFGDIPHTKLDADKSGIKKQKGRVRSIHCLSCDFRFSGSRTQLARLVDENRCNCPLCDANIESKLQDALIA